MSTSAQTIARGAQFAIVPSAVSAQTCSAWLALVDAAHRSVAVPSPDFVPESSSLRLRAITELSVVDVWAAMSSTVREHCASAVGPSVAIDVDQCWVRRQYAPHSAPPRHQPHRWHQDGALAFDFASAGNAAIPSRALLRMVTCWIALTPCGVDAPGLELVTERVDHMVSPPQLTETAVDQRWPAWRRTRPALHAGDVLVFGGDVMHRTHVSPTMTQTRTSIELRCVAADAFPDRISRDEFVAVPCLSRAAPPVRRRSASC